MNLENKVAVVTGGTKGIGYAIAESLVKAGVSVLICGRNRTELRDAVADLSKHGNAGGEVCDVRSEDQVRQMLEECLNGLTRVLRAGQIQQQQLTQGQKW